MHHARVAVPVEKITPRLRGWLPLGIILVVALVVRLAYVYKMRGVPAYGDWSLYDQFARGLLAGRYPEELEHFWSMLPPGYPLFLAGLYALFGISCFDIVRIAQALLSAGTVWVLFLLGRRLYDRRVGLLAAAVFALYPYAVFYPATIMSESLYLFLVALNLHALLWLRERPTQARAWATGLIAGAAVLTRPQHLLFVGLAALWLLVYPRRAAQARRPLLAVGIFLTGCGLAVLPWTARNVAHYGEFLLVSDNGPDVFWWGNNPIAARMYATRDVAEFNRLNAEMWGPEGERVLRRRGRTLAEKKADLFAEVKSYVRQHPGEWLRLEAHKLIVFWRPWLGGANTRRDSLASLASYGPLLVFGLAYALWECRRRSPRRAEAHLLVGLFAVHTIVVLGFCALSRYRFPVVDPYLALFASAAWVALWDRWRLRASTPSTA